MNILYICTELNVNKRVNLHLKKKSSEQWKLLWENFERFTYTHE